MNRFKEIKSTEISENLISLLKKDNMLITLHDGNKVNMMTASWGGFGELWGQDVSYAVIRPSRYSYSIIENTDKYTLCFLEAGNEKTVAYCGKVSGRDEDKVLKSKLTVCEENGYYYFNESKLVIFCEKMYAQDLKRECFKDESTAKKMYPNDDIHKLYIAKIVKILTK